jgi:hypothetical protein
MSDFRFFGVIVLWSLAMIAIGFVLGWSTNEERDK